MKIKEKKFVDRVRKIMPRERETALDYIKHAIMVAARKGEHKCVFDNRNFNHVLEDEIQWLKEQGFVVEVWSPSPCPRPYLNIITVKW